jgi:hypothetical protein
MASGLRTTADYLAAYEKISDALNLSKGSYRRADSCGKGARRCDQNFVLNVIPKVRGGAKT